MCRSCGPSYPDFTETLGSRISPKPGEGRAASEAGGASRLLVRPLSVHSLYRRMRHHGPVSPRAARMSKEIRLLSTSAILGYGFPEASFGPEWTASRM